MLVREYRENDLKDMVNIWNEIVRKALHFHMKSRWNSQAQRIFSARRVIAESRKKMERLWACIPCTPTI